MNIEGSRAANIQGTGVNLTTVTTTFGPRYTWSPRSRKLAVFGQALIGESHGLNSIFPSSSGAQTDFNTFALQVGGGRGPPAFPPISPSAPYKLIGFGPNSLMAQTTFRTIFGSPPESSYDFLHEGASVVSP